MISHTIRVAFLLVILASAANATSIKSATLEDLYQEADIVAYTEVDFDPEVGLYKLEALEAFKGVSSYDWVYINGKEFSSELGSKLVVFLRRTAKTTPSPSDNEADVLWPVYEVMYAGYSVLPVDSLRDLVDVCTSQIILPDELEPTTYEDDSKRGCGRHWVPLGKFLHYIRNLPDLRKVREYGESQ